MGAVFAQDPSPSHATAGEARPVASSQLETPAASSRQRIPRWLERMELFLRVVLRMYVGLLVCLAPWTRFWDANPLFVQYPSLSAYAMNGAARGIVSGIGLLNLWIALRDAAGHRD